MITRALIRIVLGLSLCGGIAHAQLNWPERTITLQSEAGVEEVVAVFPFTNNGDAPITISDVKTDCGCTTATLTKTTYAPGETGEIRTVFAIGNRIGREVKAIHVTTSDAPDLPVELRLEVTIPPLLTLNPRMVSWARNGEDVPQTISLSLAPGSDARIAGIAAEGEGISHSLQQVTATEYRLHLTPLDLTRVTKVRFWIRVAQPGRETKSFIAFAQVR
ncbi:MAG: DUF1573 domain-containing protein [Opitutaceae bacterium]